MSVAVQCGHCGTLNSAAAGAQRLRCGHCGTVNAVPRSGAAPSAPGAPPGVAAPRRQRTQVVLTEPGRFCHWGCQKRCCGIVGAFVLLAVLGVVLSVTVGAALAATVVTLGPTLIILGSYYNRYAASTFKAQICYTFCEAVCWLVPLSVCIAFFDPWWDRVAGEPYELECSWRARSGGKLLVHALTFAAHCNESLSLLNPRPVGSWDGLPCSLAPLGLGNGSVALPDERGCFGGSALVALESAAVEDCSFLRGRDPLPRLGGDRPRRARQRVIIDHTAPVLYGQNQWRGRRGPQGRVRLALWAAAVVAGVQVQKEPPQREHSQI
ncbi:unnamed protein product [Prorocentrum cordatum]|uniref:Protein S-acyltransferase n=1 Tax=Prorocentrum cordatum TaxID=2364126 RepID=A0ABN9S9R9_9DINO|nr:unnamed protein product [Polarella glacialis]